MRFKQGLYTPKHPEKYIGDPTKIVYRSSWEKRFFLWLDHNVGVIKWASEEFSIPYIKPTDGKVHRYFPDVFMITKKQDTEQKWVVEIKPSKDTKVSKPKVITEKTKQRMYEEAMTASINEAKWNAADAWCRDNNAIFKVMTEKELFN